MKTFVLLAFLFSLAVGLTTTIQVAAVTSPDQWLLGAGVDKVVAVNSPDDDDDSYIYIASTGKFQRYSLAVSPIPPSSTINTVSVYSRARRAITSAARLRMHLHLGGATVVGTLQTLTDSYVTLIQPFNRPGGGAWSPNDLTTLEVSVFSMTNTNMRVTSIHLEIDYTPPANTGDFFKLFP